MVRGMYWGNGFLGVYADYEPQPEPVLENKAARLQELREERHAAFERIRMRRTVSPLPEPAPEKNKGTL